MVCSCMSQKSKFLSSQSEFESGRPLLFGFYTRIFITEARTQMEPVEVVMWIDVCVCLPLTILIIYCMCCARRRDPGPAPYYIYLLVSNLIQLCAPVLWLAKLEDHHQPTGVCGVFFFFGVTTSLNFKTCIVLERYFFISCPMLNFIRKTKGSILVSVLVWTIWDPQSSACCHLSSC
ncbi:uncharacterized protein LOC106097166 [Oreochromis niloticus]|uniref:uncharacterized protein LOC106097166 n=1 Tax=Oreochromis niloticus TaxID=8128 RepID=UPI000905A55C|nr:uncharacterized protein LOC106097166 [Oreochromis niloticus]